MSSLQLYSAVYCTINGQLLSEEASVTLDKKSGLNMVYTVAKGLSGASQGATSMEATIECAIPSSDFEFLPDAFARTGAVVEIGFIAAGRQTVAKGFITDSSVSHSVNNESKLTIKATLQYADFE